MATMNIGGDAADQFYRYKMPKLQTKVEGRGNGIKTVIPNMVELSRALHMNPAYTTKFFGCELGAQAKFTDKSGLSVVNGQHDQGDLQDLLIKFINKFVLCPNCNLPETDMRVKGGLLLYHCRSCGADGSFEDQTHKLVNFILKNPPTGAGFSAAAASGTHKGDKKAGKKGDESSDEEIGMGRVDEAKPIGSGAATDVTLAGEAAVLNVDDIEADDENVQWFTDTSAEAALKRQAAAGAVKLAETDNLVENVAAVSEKIIDSLKEFMPGHSLPELSAELDRIMTDYSCSKEDVIFILFKGMTRIGIDNDSDSDKPDFKALIPKYSPAFEKLGMDRRSQRALIGAVEMYCGVDRVDCLPLAPLILQQFYDADVLDEEYILKWHGKASSRYVDKRINKKVRKVTDIFAQWLKDADEESSGEEEEDDDDE